MSENYELIKDLLSTALEGGSNYWVDSVGTDKGEGDFYDRALNTRLLLDSADHEYVLNYKDFLMGLESLKNKYPKIAERISNESWDARDADSWLQCVIFNDIIYG